MSDATAIAVKQDDPLPANASAPVSIVQIAIERGASLEQLERLLQMEQRVRADQDRRAFAAAISAAKAEIGPIAKRRTVDFTSQKGRTHYKYEDMALIADVVDPVLAKHGLSYRYRSKQESGTLQIACVLAHRDGYEEETWLSAPRDESGNKNAIQSIASTATYLQRYTLKLALGLAAGPDTDGALPKATSEPVTEDQAIELRDWLTATNGNTKAFLAHFKAESLEAFPASRFNEAVAAFKAKKAKQGNGS